jgi:SAM-dependent methyltransferase
LSAAVCFHKEGKMCAPDQGNTPERKAGTETYSYRGVAEMTGLLSRRQARTQAAFFTPYLHAGMRLLDCGCGPGSITCDLAGIVIPGEVLGIDFDPKQVELATAYAAQRGVTNVRFQPADVYALPFPEGSFDAVFASGLVEHLSEPLRALQEMRRVLRPGGLLGVRAGDADGLIVAPQNSEPAKLAPLVKQMQALHGHDACIGKHLRGLFHQAGCVGVVASASCDYWGTPESLGAWVEAARSLVGPDGPLARLGLIDAERAAQLAAGLRAWAEDPSAFLALPYCEAVGQVE